MAVIAAAMVGFMTMGTPPAVAAERSPHPPGSDRPSATDAHGQWPGHGVAQLWWLASRQPQAHAPNVDSSVHQSR
ncbi:hypothetical protein A7R75_12700 [Mycolicibacterium llatzerense]|nr:hypothetical protein [Mycolicibacterium llatzerense]